MSNNSATHDKSGHLRAEAKSAVEDIVLLRTHAALEYGVSDAEATQIACAVFSILGMRAFAMEQAIADFFEEQKQNPDKR